MRGKQQAPSGRTAHTRINARRSFQLDGDGLHSLIALIRQPSSGSVTKVTSFAGQLCWVCFCQGTWGLRFPLAQSEEGKSVELARSSNSMREVNKGPRNP